MESPIVVASNRGPVSFEHDGRANSRRQRGAGGLVTALSGVFFRDDTTWVAAAMTDGDREVAAEGYELDPDSHQRVRFVVIPPDDTTRYYNQMANRILWFLHHYLWDTARTPMFDDETEAVWQEFVEANRSFALRARRGGRPRSRLPDPGLPPVPRVPAMLRELRPDARIVHFTHTPFAGATYLRILPAHMRDAILRGMAGADVVGFQARPWVESFLLSVRGLSGIPRPARRALRGRRSRCERRARSRSR